MTTLKTENLSRAMDDFGFAADHLRDALREASALESLLLLPLIERAATLRKDVNAILRAMEAKE